MDSHQLLVENTKGSHSLFNYFDLVQQSPSASMMSKMQRKSSSAGLKACTAV